MLFVKVGSGDKYLRKINSVEYLRKSDFEGEYWPYLSDEVAYIHEDKYGYHVAGVDRVIEIDEAEVEKMFPLITDSVWYKIVPKK